MRLRPDRFFNAIYAWCLARISSEEDMQRFLFTLNEPPPDLRITPQVIAAEMDSFADFASAFGVTAPADR